VERGEDFFLISSPLFSNMHNRQKFKAHKKSRNICLKAHHYALTVQIWAHSGIMGFFMNFELLLIMQIMHK
jgi:hypothetical protein